MMHWRTDPRDIGVPGSKQWEEFRATFSAFRIIGWLVAEVDDLSSTEDYFGDVAALPERHFQCTLPERRHLGEQHRRDR